MQELKDTIMDYIRREHTSYAIMLDGKWGSGKTYFWNTELKPEIEAVKKNDKLLKTVYISLYGISDIDEINRKIVYEIYASMSAKKIGEKFSGNIVPEIGKIVLSLGNVVGLDTEKILKGGSDTLDSLDKLFNLKQNIVFCFDDLERASMDVHLILGFINNLVEHDNVKTIIIGNEEEILNKAAVNNQELKNISSTFLLSVEDKIIKSKAPSVNRSFSTDKDEEKQTNQDLIQQYNEKYYGKRIEYKLIKEKLIGKTLTFKTDIVMILESVLANYKNDDYCNFLHTNRGLIKEVFFKSQTNNFRLLQHALDDFEAIYVEFNQRFLNCDNSILLDMLHFMLAYSFDLKSGNNDVANFKEIVDASDYTSRLIISGMYKDNDEHKAVVRFNKKYFKHHLQVFFKVIEMFAREGLLRKEMLVEEIEKYINEVERNRKPLYFLLLSNDYKELSDEDFISISNDTYTLMKNGDMTFYHYYYAFIMYRKFSEAGLFPLSVDEMFNDFTEGLDKTLSKSSYIDNDRLHRQIQLNVEEDTQIASIREKIISINRELRERLQKRLALDALKLLESHDIGAFVDKLDEQFTSKSFFCIADVVPLFESILTLSNQDLNTFVTSIMERYDSNYYKQNYASDKVFFDELRMRINEYVVGKDITLKNHILIEFSKSMETLFDMQPNG